MQANIAIGLIETSSIAKGIEAADAMCKMASVTLVKTSIIARGKYTILISGPVGEVESSLRAGLDIAKDTVVHQLIIRNVHQQVLDTLEKRVPVAELDAVGIIETKEAIAAIHAADAAAKAASVRLLETKAVVGGGKGMVTMTGEVGAVRSAVAAGIAVVPKSMLVTQVVIPQADKQLLAQVGK
ncbi:MAG: BMC domain-containing protein [Elusimicrobia bacterium]|nr:BMC domain-containing protein [Elusimicrobiota bacterium]